MLIVLTVADRIAHRQAQLASLIASPRQTRRPGAHDAAGIGYALAMLYVGDAPIDTLRLDYSPVVRRSQARRM